MQRLKVWDPFVRVFHWALVTLFVTNALITDPEKNLHIWVGYAVAGLVAARLIWGFIGSPHARFSDFPPSVTAAAGQMGDMVQGTKTRHAGHSPLGAWMIYNLLFALIAISVTGYMMTMDAFWGMEGLEELHEFAVTWAELSVVVHVAAVVLESRRTKVNLPRAMVTGYKDFENT